MLEFDVRTFMSNKRRDVVRVGPDGVSRCLSRSFKVEEKGQPIDRSNSAAVAHLVVPLKAVVEDKG